MPEEPEIETENLHEAIHEELEREGAPLLRNIALTTAILAAFAAVASLEAGTTVNEALVLKTEATRFQAQASDQWSYYQAKGIKLAVRETETSVWKAAGRPAPAELADQLRRYATEQQAIQAKAVSFEHDRDHVSHEADELLHRHHGFANAVTLFQVAIALGAVAALTRIRLVWLASGVLGLSGLAFFAFTLLR